MRGTHIRPSHSHWYTWLAAAVLALLFTYFEQLKAHRTRLWVGGDFRQWIEAGAAFVVYAGILGLLIEILGGAKTVVLRKRLPLDAVMALGASLLLWATLSFHREYTPTADDLLVVGALLALTGAGMILTQIGRMSLPAFFAVCGVAFGAGISAVVSAANLFFFHPSRTDLVTSCSIAWLGIAGAAAAWAWMPTHKSTTLKLVTVIAVLGVPLVAMKLLPVSLRRPQREGKPNIILITVDALRADYCSVYGGETPTPCLEHITQEGVLFQRSYALAPWTPPSVPAMFASDYPRRLVPVPPRRGRHPVDAYCFVPDGTTTLAELLAAEGYVTKAFVANPLLRMLPGVFRGFDEAQTVQHLLRLDDGVFAYAPFLQETLTAWFPRLSKVRYIDSTHILTRYTQEFLRRNRHTPFFLWVHYMDPHHPYDPPGRYRAPPPPGSDMPLIPSEGLFQALKDTSETPEDDALKAYGRSLYEGEVRHVDHAIGEILETLSVLGLNEHTYVCITADHGEEFWDHGKYGHGQSVYGELLHVPLLFWGPGLVHRNIQEPISAIDIMPTLADLAQVARPRTWRGESWARMLMGDDTTAPARPCFAIVSHPLRAEEVMQTVISGDRKLIHRIASNRFELYDLLEDPAEQKSLHIAQKKLVRRLHTQILDWANSLPPPLDMRGTVTDPAILEQLRALGYLEMAVEK